MVGLGALSRVATASLPEAVTMNAMGHTVPTMIGVEMGGMFTVFKVRKDQKRGDYSDPGCYRHPPGTLAYEGQVRCPSRNAVRMQAGSRCLPCISPMSR